MVLRGSKKVGFPVLTLQKAHALVQVSPIIIKVACFLLQHSEIFGQLASWQTVCKFFFINNFFSFKIILSINNFSSYPFGFFLIGLIGLLIFSGCLNFILLFLYKFFR